MEVLQKFLLIVGAGYEIGDDLVLQIQIQVVVQLGKSFIVNGGIVVEEGTTGMTEGEDHLVLEDETQRGDHYW